MKMKFLLLGISLLSVFTTYSQVKVDYVDPVPDTVYVQKITKQGFEDKEIQTWQAQDYAQRQLQKRFEWGVKGGVNTMGITKKSQVAFNTQFENIGGIYKVNNNNTGVGWQIGAFGRVNFGKFNIQLEALYHNSRNISTLMHTDDAPDCDIKSDITFGSIDIPVELGIKFSIFRIYLGPQFSIPLNPSYKLDNTAAKEYMSAVDNGYVIDKVNFVNPSVFFHWGVSFEFWHLVIDVRNVVPFKKSSQEFHILERTTSENMRLNSWQFMLGFKF